MMDFLVSRFDFSNELEGNKINWENRSSLLTLPSNYVSCKKAFAEEFRNATNVPQQICAVKKIFNNGRNDGKKMRFLADLLFDAARGHPVRNEIINLFNTYTRTVDEDTQNKKIISVLKQSIHSKLSVILNLKDDGAKNNGIISISGCFYNFPSGLQALKANYEKFVVIIFDTMTSFYQTLRNSEKLTPHKTNEYCNFMGSLIKSILWSIHEFPAVVKDYADRMKKLIETIFELLNNNKIPMKTRLNTALLMLKFGKDLGIMDELLTYGLKSNQPQQLPFVISVLNAFGTIDYEKNSLLLMDICAIIVKTPVQPQDLIYSLNALLQFARSLNDIALEECKREQLLHTKLSLRLILLFGISHLEHDNDLISHQCRDLIKDIIVIARQFDFHQLIDKVYENCTTDRMPLKTKCFLLEQSEADDYNRCPLVFFNICSKIMKCINQTDRLPDEWCYSFCALIQFVRNMRKIEIASSFYFNLALWNIIIFTIPHLENSIHTICQLCHELVQEILLSAKHFDFHELINKLFKMCNSESITLPSKCILLQQIAFVHGIQEVTENCQSLFLSAFSDYIGRVPTVDQMCENLMISTYATKCFHTWTDTWLIFLMNVAILKDERLPSVERIFKSVMHLDNRIVDMIVQKHELSVSTQLSVLFSKHKSSFQLELYGNSLTSFVKIFRDAVISSNTMTAQMALRTVVKTEEFTESMNDFKWEIVATFFDYQLNNPDPAVRGKTYALLKEAITKWGLQLGNEYKNPSDVKDKNLDQIFFLRYIMHSLMANMFPGANCSRRLLALQLLKQCLDICKSIKLPYNSLLPNCSVRSIFNMLNDSIWDNKLRALEILKQLEEQEPLGLIQIYKLPLTKEGIKNMLTSLRPMDSATGTFQLDFLCNLKTNLETFGSCPTGIKCEPTVYVALKWCMKELLAGLKMAQQDLNRAAKFNPMYGLLYAIRHLLKKINLRAIAMEPLWRTLIVDLVKRCKALKTVVGPIMNYPQGLSAQSVDDFSDPIAFFYDFQNPEMKNRRQSSHENELNKIDGSEFVTKRLNPAMLEKFKATPQMIFSFAWRTVKEVSGILGYIIMKAPLEYDSKLDDYLFNKTQIMEIGVHLKELLDLTYHSRAFKNVFIAFSSYCERLWRIDSTYLNLLPMQWLKNNLNYILELNHTPSLHCVPYIVQTIVTTELQHGSSYLLDHTLRSLLKCCEDHRDAALEKRIYSMNIMRHLFRCSVVNGRIDPYITECVMCALKCCNKLNRRESFTSTMLYAELLKRIFDEQNNEYPMTIRIFFSRYPDLYDYLRNELKSAVKLLQNSKCALQLHPILMLLSHFDVSSPDSTNLSDLIFTDFIPLITSCFCITNDDIRNLVGRVLVGLLDKSKVQEVLLYKCEQLLTISSDPDQDQTEVTTNSLHGILVAILYLLKTLEFLTPNVVKYVIENLFQFSMAYNMNNILLLKGIYEILIMIVESHTTLSSYGQEDVEKFKYFIRMGTKVIKIGGLYPQFHRYYENFCIHMLRLVSNEGTLMYYFPQSLVEIDIAPIGTIETLLNVILVLFCTDSSFTYTKEETEFKQEFIKSFKCYESELKFCVQLSSHSRTEFAKMLRCNKSLLKQLTNVIEKKHSAFPNSIISKCCAILSMLQNAKFDLQKLIAQCKYHEDKVPITMCMIRHIQDNGIESKLWSPLLNHALKIVEPQNPFFLRFTVVKLVQHIGPYFREQFGSLQLDIIGPYVKLVLLLLMDEKISIRDVTSKILLKHLKDQIDIRKFIKWSDCDEDAIYAQSEECLVPALAQQLFLQNIADVLQEVNAPEDFLIEFFSFIVKPYLPSLPEKKNDVAASGETQEDISIDGTEAANAVAIGMADNDYAEPLRVLMDMLIVYRQTFENRKALLKQLDPYEKYLWEDLA